MSVLKSLKALFVSPPSLSPADAFAHVKAGKGVFIDVREPGEWASGVIQGALLLPLSDLTGKREQWTKALASHAGKELYVYCASGGRSRMAANLLNTDGHKAFNLGGYSDLSPFSPKKRR